MVEVLEEYNRLEAAVIKNLPGVDPGRIRSAFEYAYKAHGEQKRKDGSLFITHPLAAAEIVLDIGLDEDSVCAALLHDCIEDTDITYEDIEKLFGKDVAVIVEGVTKLTRVQYTSKEEEQMENFRKMLIAMAKDIRVILIKIADRLHNIRTLEYTSPETQRTKALETMEMYAPIAHRLGMQKVKWELEDLSIQYLDPVGCEAIIKGLEQRSEKDEEFMNGVQAKIHTRLNELEIESTVYGRVKHLYSIYRKMYDQNKELSEIMDLYAFRVIVNDIADCYNVLGYLHDLFYPIPGSFKDYIGTPKPNMYQSLHTIVIGTEGTPIEVQIRTWEMHHIAEYGVAAHWKYKEGKEGQVNDEEKFAWVRRLLESHQDSDAEEFIQSLKVDMFADQVFVFTPQGDVVNLPAGATPIDFAYSIHSAVGNRMTGATVNGRMVPYSHILQNGDIVKILTSNASKGPSRDWLEIIKSSEARNKIRQWFKKEKREENIIHGKLAFETELRHANISPIEVMDDEELIKNLLTRTSFNTTDELFAAIGYGGITAHRAANRVRDELRNAKKVKTKDDIALPKARRRSKVRPAYGVMVEGLDNCLVKFAKCCAPVPGDPVVGFITRGFGVSVHRQDCENYRNPGKASEKNGRWVSVNWANTDDKLFSATIQIESRERAGVVADIALALNSLKVKITSFSAKELGDGTAFTTIDVDIKNRDELITAMAKIMAVRGITSVRRK